MAAVETGSNGTVCRDARLLSRIIARLVSRLSVDASKSSDPDPNANGRKIFVPYINRVFYNVQNSSTLFGRNESYFSNSNILFVEMPLECMALFTNAIQ